jgi:hypothetical protein
VECGFGSRQDQPSMLSRNGQAWDERCYSVMGDGGAVSVEESW